MNHCEECGKPYAGTGEWHEVSSVPSFHVGEFETDRHIPKTPAFLYLIAFDPNEPGAWRCCGQRVEAGMPGVNAVIRDLKDPQEYADA
jgi:hypothetical protein